MKRAGKSTTKERRDGQYERRIPEGAGSILRDLQAVPGILRGVLRPFQVLALGAGLLFCLVTMFYADMTVTGPFSVLLWDALLDGKPFSFYGLCLSSGIAPEGAVYDIGLYAVFAVWNLPVWLLHHLAGVSLTAPGALLWYKLLPTAAALAGVNAVREIAGALGAGEQEARESGVFFLLSSMVILPVFVTAQYDSMPLYCILRGVLWYLREPEALGEEKRRAHRRCLLWFALSLVLKPLGILILFLLVILREKRLLRIAGEMGKGCSLLLVCKLVCSVSADYRASASGFLAQHLPDLLEARLSGGYGEISLFALGLVLLYLAAYLYDGSEREPEENGRMAVVFAYGIWAVFCAFGNMTPYWTIYLAPFLVLTIGLGGRRRIQLLFADLVGELALVMVLIMKFSWVYGGEKTFAYLLLKPQCGKILSGERAVTVAGALRSLSIETYLPVLEAILVGWLLMTGIAAYRNVTGRPAAVRQQGAAQLRETGQPAGRGGSKERCRVSEEESAWEQRAVRHHADVRILLLFAWIGELLMGLRYMM